jgi:creatinine amidohydrolase/Fe(II)-dependent formamide hydrolase-like protein
MKLTDLQPKQQGVAAAESCMLILAGVMVPQQWTIEQEYAFFEGAFAMLVGAAVSNFGSRRALQLLAQLSKDVTEQGAMLDATAAHPEGGNA